MISSQYIVLVWKFGGGGGGGGAWTHNNSCRIPTVYLAVLPHWFIKISSPLGENRGGGGESIIWGVAPLDEQEFL